MKSKHLFSTGVAIVAAVAVAAPAWAQTEGGNSYGGNSMGIPGPNPGGPYIPGTIDGGLFGHTPSPPAGFDLGDAGDALSRSPGHSRGRPLPQIGASDPVYGRSAEPGRTRPPSIR
jgi:hypothetical protein